MRKLFARGLILSVDFAIKSKKMLKREYCGTIYLTICSCLIRRGNGRRNTRKWRSKYRRWLMAFRVGRSIRPDIRYRRVASSHVIIELKRPLRRLKKTAIEEQVKMYIRAVRLKINQMKESPVPVEAVCIVGKLPLGWDDPTTRKEDEDSLKVHSIRIMTYDELINNAYSAYAKYIEVSVPTSDIRDLIERIRNYRPRSSDRMG